MAAQFVQNIVIIYQYGYKIIIIIIIIVLLQLNKNKITNITLIFHCKIFFKKNQIIIIVNNCKITILILKAVLIT